MFGPRRVVGLLLALMLAACADDAPRADSVGYDLHFQARMQPATSNAAVTIRLTQQSAVIRALDFNAPASRYSDFSGDGEIEVGGDRVHWVPPDRGGSLRYNVTVNRIRGGVQDTRLTDRWAVFRLDHLFPPARTRVLGGAVANATLSLNGPAGWRFETPYGPSNEPLHRLLDDRRFPRPVGWAIAGEIGVRRDEIAGRRVAVAAPVGEAFRRQDTLAFLRWTLPALIEVFPNFPERLLIVGSAGDMWRGGLSGPASLYVHPDRPLISGNATSTLLHELVHVAIGSKPGNSDDWLVEGLAEYYSMELLRRTGGISEQRFDAALDWLKAWSEREDGRLADPSTGANTAYAALALHQLATTLAGTDRSLDALVNRLIREGQITGAALREQLTSMKVSAAPFAAAP